MAGGDALTDQRPEGGSADKPMPERTAAPADARPAATNPFAAPATASSSAAPDAEPPAAPAYANLSATQTDGGMLAWPPNRNVMIAGAAVLGVLLLAVLAVPHLVSLFTLPECNDEGPRRTLTDYFAQRNVKLTRLGEVKSLSSSRSERTCAARADAQGRVL